MMYRSGQTPTAARNNKATPACSVRSSVEYGTCSGAGLGWQAVARPIFLFLRSLLGAGVWGYVQPVCGAAHAAS